MYVLSLSLSLYPFLVFMKQRSNKVRNKSAFGHPLGCTGARQVVTALSELRRQDKRIAVTSMCVGTVSLPACRFYMTLLTILID